MNYILKPEEAECFALTEYLEILKSQGKVLLFSHLDQDTTVKNFWYLNKRKKLGVRPGVPDYLIVTKDKTIFLEMKRPKGGKVSSYQKEWLEHLASTKTVPLLAHGFDQAKEQLDKEIV